MAHAIGAAKGLRLGVAKGSRVSDAHDAEFSTFYRAFSEHFRGPFEVVKRRLTAHANHLMRYAPLPGPVLDLGVGRGEWIELLRERDVQASGVDSNADIVAAAQSRGAAVVHGDALERLESLPPNSLGAVSAFHLIEHFGPAQRVRLFTLAFRALAPSGRLLLEWPNVANARVAQYTFWLDPTHQLPLPCEVAEFIARYAGFTDIELPRIDDGQPVGFEAPDIGLWARKP